jgi:hypothetical protein
MLKIMIDKKKAIDNVLFEGTTREIYRELMCAVVSCLDDLEIETSKGKVTLSEAIITFGQHLIMFATQQQKELDMTSELKKKLSDVISDLEKRREE